MKQNKLKQISLNSILIFISVVMLFPTFWMLLISLTKPNTMTSIIDLLQGPFTTINYREAFASDSFGTYFMNSLIVATLVTVGNLFFCTTVAYAFSRKNFIGKKLLFLSILGVLMIPQHVIMIPLYRLMVNFSWINTYYALIIPWLVTPFGIFMVKQYIDSLPIEIENAAKIDGAGEWYILFKIIFPLSKPILSVLAVYTFLMNWNSFLFPFLFTNDEGMRTLPVGLAFYMGKQSIDWSHLMAGASISALPILILFILFQKTIIKSLTAGALK